MAMSSAAILASENQKLFMENQRQKKKRARKRMYIGKGGVLTGAERLSLAQGIRAERNAVKEATS
jgi:hypothetical protein